MRPALPAPSIQNSVERAVVRGELVELREVILVVGFGIGVALVVPVPGREIDAEAKSCLVGGVGGHADEVSFAIEPGAVFDAVVGLLAGPEGEAVVMLGDEHSIFVRQRLSQLPSTGRYRRGRD